LELSGNITEEYTKSGYNKKSLPGNDHDVESSSSAADVINNIIVIDVKMNGQDYK
jgi:hypothetical protein